MLWLFGSVLDGLTLLWPLRSPAPNYDPEDVLSFERVTRSQLLAYDYSRRLIRLASFGIASFAGGIFWLYFPAASLQISWVVYVLSTVRGILYARFVLGILFPRMIYPAAIKDHRVFVQDIWVPHQS